MGSHRLRSAAAALAGGCLALGLASAPAYAGPASAALAPSAAPAVVRSVIRCVAGTHVHPYFGLPRGELPGSCRGQAWVGAGADSSGVLSPADVDSVSCASAGSCSAGGSFADNSGNVVAALVVSQKDGAWATPRVAARGTAPFMQPLANTESVSCASAGTCSAGGFYEVGRDDYAFVIGERNGIWGQAEKVPGVAGFNPSEEAGIWSVSCPSAGTCSAAGWYLDGHGIQWPFVVGETHGRWGVAQVLPGLTGLTRDGAGISQVSCASPGNCGAGGSYSTASDHLQAFVVSEKNGVWGPVANVRSLVALNTGGWAGINSVSCPSVGDCSAGGFYAVGKSQAGHAFVVDDRDGVWGTAQQVPTRRLGVNAEIASVSCVRPGNCSAGGNYTGSGAGAFVLSQKNGTWGTAQQVPGLARLGGAGSINSISCPSAGNCSAGGDYDVGGCCFGYGFVVSERHGIWGSAEPVPGLVRPGHADMVAAVSCGSPGDCSAGGSYGDASPVGRGYAFVINQQDGIWGTAHALGG